MSTSSSAFSMEPYRLSAGLVLLLEDVFFRFHNKKNFPKENLSQAKFCCGNIRISQSQKAKGGEPAFRAVAVFSSDSVFSVLFASVAHFLNVW